ncbi:unnamed protein product [Bursaphelenchus xylophilus]|uniref:(pine wood nematode) hypothetical protein n=1 Tax=Bursaphelenchus xylophilus TaxID=6326 RepID=A0A1I7ST80_BURXY|nr:unnamed protein product [Bursaphelenchus xylophilus]CAG9108663.1 unnamed protein product [Bursaphelenchus xylophilus]
MNFTEDVDVISYLEEKFPDLDPEEGLKYPCRYLIDSSHIPVFTEALHTLMEFGLSLLFFPDINGITIKNCNISRTASGHVFFSTEFFGAVRTYEWPATVPCASISVRDIALMLKKMDKHRNIEYFVLDLEPLADGLVVRITYRNGIDTELVLKTREIYANSLPRDERPESVTSVMNVLGREFRNVLTTLGKLKEVGIYVSLFGVVLHTICSRSLRSRSKKSAVQMRDLINATLMVEESFIEVDVKDLLMLSKFAASNDEIMKFYFTQSEAPLFVVVDMSGLCSISFVLSTGMVDPVMTRNVIRQMIPSLREDGHVTSIRLFNVSDVNNTGNRTVIDFDKDQMDEDEYMDRMVLGISRSKALPRQDRGNVADELHNMSLNAWNNDQAQAPVTQRPPENHPARDEVLGAEENMEENVMGVNDVIYEEQTRSHPATRKKSQGVVKSAEKRNVTLTEEEPPRIITSPRIENMAENQSDVNVCDQIDVNGNNQRLDTSARPVSSRNQNYNANRDDPKSVEMINEEVLDEVTGLIPFENFGNENIAQNETECIDGQAHGQVNDIGLEFRDPCDIEICTQQPMRAERQFDMGVILGTAPPFVFEEDEHYNQSGDFRQQPTSSMDSSVNEISRSQSGEFNERSNVHTKLYRNTIFETVNPTNPSECTREAFLYQKSANYCNPGKDRVPTRFDGGGHVSGDEPEILHFINLKPASFWTSTFSIRPLENDISD